jgi:hypothetical protein
MLKEDLLPGGALSSYFISFPRSEKVSLNQEGVNKKLLFPQEVME